MVYQLAVIIDDLDGVADSQVQLARIEGAALLRNEIWSTGGANEQRQGTGNEQGASSPPC